VDVLLPLVPLSLLPPPLTPTLPQADTSAHRSAESTTLRITRHCSAPFIIVYRIP
jgi:hypothetical protein